MKINKYFDIKEVVSPAVYKQYSDKSIQFLDPVGIEVLENVREILGVPLICNDGINRTQCGYRGDDCNIGAPASMHKKGKAYDLISLKMTAKEMREKLEANEDKLKYPIRIEK